MVEGARLESVFRGNSNEGSNPSLSASNAKDVCRDLNHSRPASAQKNYNFSAIDLACKNCSR